MSIDSVFVHKMWDDKELSKMVGGGVPYFNELFKRKTGDRLQRLQTKENPEQRLG
jgi:hypothetical protein